MTITTVPVRPKVVSGRSLGHTELTPTAKAFLVVDADAGRVTLKQTFQQLCDQVGVSQTYASAAKRVDTNPQLRARVESEKIALMDAAKAVRPQRKRPAPPDVVELFDEASPEMRAQCMRKHLDEAFSVVDAATSPDPGETPVSWHEWGEDPSDVSDGVWR